MYLKNVNSFLKYVGDVGWIGYNERKEQLTSIGTER